MTLSIEEQIVINYQKEIKSLKDELEMTKIRDDYVTKLEQKLEKIVTIVKRHNGSDSHARQLFDEIEIELLKGDT